MIRILTVGIISTVPVLEAAAPIYYLHAANCQEIGGGESGAIHRSYLRITNVGTTPKQVICHVPVRDDSNDSGRRLVVEVNVNDHHSTGVKASICRRDRWGAAQSCDEVWTVATEGFATLVLELEWIDSNYYTMVVELPPNSGSNYTRFHTYRVFRY